MFHPSNANDIDTLERISSLFSNALARWCLVYLHYPVYPTTEYYFSFADYDQYELELYTLVEELTFHLSNANDIDTLERICSLFSNALARLCLVYLHYPVYPTTDYYSSFAEYDQYELGLYTLVEELMFQLSNANDIDTLDCI